VVEIAWRLREGKSFEAVFDDPLSFGEPECIKVSESGPLEPLKRLNTI